jgi:hypothetical protein
VNNFDKCEYKSVTARRPGLAETSQQSQFCNDMPSGPENVFPAGVAGN